MVAICRRKLLLLLLIRRVQKRSKLKYRKSFWVRPINKERKQQGEHANLIIYGQEVSTAQNFLKNSFYPSIANKLFWHPQHLHISGSASVTFFCTCLLSHAILPLRKMLSPLNHSQLQSGPMQIPVHFCSCNY